MTRQMVRKRGGQSGGKKMKEEEELGTYARDGTQLPYSYFHFVDSFSIKQLFFSALTVLL